MTTGIPIPTSNIFKKDNFRHLPPCTTAPWQVPFVIVSKGMVLEWHRRKRGMRLAETEGINSNKKHACKHAAILKQTLLCSNPPKSNGTAWLAYEKGESAWVTSDLFQSLSWDSPYTSKPSGDILFLRNGRELARFPTHCSCYATFIMAFICRKGSFLYQTWQHLTHHRGTTSIEDNAKQDVKAQGLCGSKTECALFNMRVFSTFMLSNCYGAAARS